MMRALVLPLALLLLVPLGLASHTATSCIDMLGGTGRVPDIFTANLSRSSFYFVADNGHGWFLYQETNGRQGLQRADQCYSGYSPADRLILYESCDPCR